MKFKKWFIESVDIDYSKYQAAIADKTQEMIDYMQDREYRLDQFKPDAFLQQIQIQLKNYPQLGNFVRSLQSKNPHYIFDQLKRLRNWTGKQPDRRLRDIWTQTFDYIDAVRPRQKEWETDLKQKVQNFHQKTQTTMQQLQKMIQDAIGRVARWNASPVQIEVRPAEDDRGAVLDASEAAGVRVGSGRMSPDFTVWLGEKGLDIDDVIEGGDEDFFSSSQVQADYFNLINELKKPGSTSKGKILTLYTARPKADRERYLKSPSLPVNVFLSNSYDHVEGIARDLATKEGERDIWKVRIDSRYLTQTLDGHIKYYQVTSDNTPAKMDLVHVGD